MWTGGRCEPQKALRLSKTVWCAEGGWGARRRRLATWQRKSPPSETRPTNLGSDMKLLQWMVGANLALSLAILVRLFMA